MSLRTALSTLVLAATSLAGCFIPDDYNPCGGPCPDAQFYDAGITGDTGALLTSALGPTTMADVPPPALAGGTLLTLRASSRAVLADPDTDTIRVLDLTLPAQLGQVALSPHDEPGRSVEDGAGRVHVVLRGAGVIATLDVSDPSAPVVSARRGVCPVPRGLAYDPAADVLYVACMGGELVTLPPLGPPVRTATLPDDLRDVVVDGARLWITRFRSAEVLDVDPLAGTVTHTLPIPSITGGTHAFAPAVAWRALAMPQGGALVLHQIERSDAVAQADAGFGGVVCADAVVQARLSRMGVGTLGGGATLPCAVLAVDAALSPDASAVTVAIAGAVPLDGCHQLATFSLRSDGALGAARNLDCTAFAGRVVAVAYAADGRLVAQTRAPLGIVVSSFGSTRDLQLPGPVVTDTGFELFHSSTSEHVACASCHPEGGEDGRVWVFDDADERRTMSLRAGVLATAPFDWHGEAPTFARVIDDVLTRQMGGGALSTGALDATGRWLDAQPVLGARAIEDGAAIARGQTLFTSAALGCSDCHSGARGSNQATVDVGTGGALQVPSLQGVGYRAPFFHDGCAASLPDVFGTCAGGGAHSVGATVSGAELDDLLAYLSSL